MTRMRINHSKVDVLLGKESMPWGVTRGMNTTRTGNRVPY